MKKAVLLVKSALALSELQLAFPLVLSVDIIGDLVRGKECIAPLEVVLQLIAPITIPSNQLSRGDGGPVTLSFSPPRIQEELTRLLKDMNRLGRHCNGNILDRLLRTTHLFTAAVSQADYMAWIVLLSSSIEALASTAHKYLEYTNKQDQTLDPKTIRNKIIGAYQLKLHNHTKTQLRNAIVHGKLKHKNLDVIETEEIIYNPRAIESIERELSPRTRIAIREFTENPEQFIERIRQT